MRTAIAALRARQWAHFALLPAAALGPASGADTRVAVARGAAIASLCLAYAYGLNAIADRRMDASPRKNPLAGVEQMPPAASWLVAGCAASALGLAATGAAVVVLSTLLCLVAGTAYSVGPRLKAVPVVGTVLNAAIFAPLLAVGLGDAPRPPAFGACLATFTALILQNQLLHERADADEDARGRVVTTARVLGERGTARLTAWIGAVGVVAAAWLAPSSACALASTLTLVAASAVCWRRAEPAERRRRAHRWASLLGGAAIFAAGWLSAGQR